MRKKIDAGKCVSEHLRTLTGLDEGRCTLLDDMTSVPQMASVERSAGAACADAPGRDGVFSVSAFGAAGDGLANDTAAIQHAIDACSASGGGQVRVGPGTYRTGTIYLHDRIELHLCAGATLRGSPDREDYNADEAFVENRPFAGEHVTAAHLIVGHGLRDFAITGCGTIDGNASAFFETLPPSGLPDTYRAPRRKSAVKSWRPGQMIWLCRCRNVQIRDVALRDSPYWNLLLLGCEDVRIRGLDIRNPSTTPNGDGIDLDCCRNVIVSDCRIFTGDDCIAVRGDTGTLGEDKACENIVVSNCILSTPANGVRVGVGDGTIRDCLFHGLVFVNSRVGINMVARFPGPSKRGALIERVSFDNLNIDAILALQALHGTATAAGRGFRQIAFSNVRARVTAGAYVGGNADNPAEDFRFRDWDIQVQDETFAPDFIDRVRFPDPFEGCLGADGERNLPAALYVRHVHGIQARDICVHWRKPLRRKWLRDTWFDACREKVV